MKSDEVDFNRSRPTHPMYYDREMLFSKDRRFWLSLIVFMVGGMYAKARYLVEKDRWQ